MKKFYISLAAVFIIWTVLDFLIQELALGAIYDSTAYIWRPRQEMKLALSSLATLLSAGAFAGIFTFWISEKTLKSGLKFGALYGLAIASIVSLGMYSILPIPFSLCIGWFLGHLVRGIAAGVVVGAVFESEDLS